eukprot:Colp12_sorted_trinity150504_noHs@31826
MTFFRDLDTESGTVTPQRAMADHYPQNVGVLALEVYFPSTCVSQTALETFDGASAGKYTIGLGQTNMAFCTDREDINSICLTVVKNLMTRHNISYDDVGRLEVGTETIIDKSKSVKTVLMQLFQEKGNTEIEGIDTTNACYGGTAALFNSLAWLESSAWNGKYAIVVAGDIAVYAKGNARPTGGAGVVAMVLGPNAPLVIERGLRATHMEHVYDFYKPDLSSEYPEVDGKLSIECYLRALDVCYTKYGKRYEVLTGNKAEIDMADFYVFHSPFNKLVQKSFGRLFFNDFLNGAMPEDAELEQFKGLKREDTYANRAVETTFVGRSKKVYETKVAPSTLLAKELGNMYTGSLYSGLVSLMVQKNAAELANKRLIMFSYGSGFAASMFSIRVVPGAGFDHLLAGLADVKDRLASRHWIAPEEFDKTMQLRDETHNLRDYRPTTPVDSMFPATFYIEHVDSMFRRFYKQTEGTVKPLPKSLRAVTVVPKTVTHALQETLTPAIVV